MNTFKNSTINKRIKHKLSLLLFCLQSIDLYALDEIYIKRSNKSLKIPSRLHKSNNNQDILTIIHLIQKIARKVHNQKIMLSILKNYIHYYTNIDCAENLTKKYLARFQYKYDKNLYEYASKLRYDKTTSKFYQLAIINLYILYKTSLKEGPYILLKYIYT